MVQLQNFFFFITFMVVPRGTAAPVLFQWFVSRDVPIGAPSFNGTLIPIPISLFPLMVYLPFRKFIRSMDGEKSAVNVRARRPIQFSDNIGRSSKKTIKRNVFFCFVPVPHFFLLESKGDFLNCESFCGVLSLLFFRTFFYLPRNRLAKRERAPGLSLRPNGNEQRRNGKMRYTGHPYNDLERRVERSTKALKFAHTAVGWEIGGERDTVAIRDEVNAFRRALGLKVEGFGPVAFPVSPPSGGACVWGVPPEIELFALTLPLSRQRMAVGHDYYQKVFMKINISHRGVCISMLGVFLSNTKMIQFTQRSPLGSELHMGRERSCLRGLDHLHGPTLNSICGNCLIYKPFLTNDRLMFEHDKELRADLFLKSFLASYENGKQEHFPHRWMKNRKHKNLSFSMFPEKRYFRETTNTTEVAIHTNIFSNLYALIGTGSFFLGGWSTTIIKIPFLLFLRTGFLVASLGGFSSLLRQKKKNKLRWH